VEREDDWGLEAVVAELRADVRHLTADVAELKHELRTDIRRLDDRIFKLMLLQLGTLATALASLVAALVS
jgi:hypothetical protein